MNFEINEILNKFKEGLNLNGVKKVFEENRELSADSLLQPSHPEDYTRDHLIDPIIAKLGLEKISSIVFEGIGKEKRSIDYFLKNQKNMLFLVEAKPVNAKLSDKKPDSAVNQIKGIFRLGKVQRDYKFGIATDGLKWIFIDKNSIVVYELDITKDFDKIKNILIGEQEVSSEIIEEEISKKFYDRYNALLHGGKTISTKDCLVENIVSVTIPEEREQIAQTIMDRLIFLKFLQSKNIVGYDILDYLMKLDENMLNGRLRQLFFEVLNTNKSERVNVDPKFRDIPYLNGSLFVRTDIELRNPDYKIKAHILKEIIKFLNSFKFVHTENVSNQRILDPEILGYIFEKAMTSTDRKGTGAYYTPKKITKYISENTIYPVIVKKVNKLLKGRGWKEYELLENIEDVYRIRSPKILQEVFTEIILKLKICDNACGSGAFLLAAANVLLDIYKRMNEVLKLENSEIALRKLILKNNLYGVDINPNAIEIAKLRLWLWLVTVYEIDKIEPLPNIDYNIIFGNTLIGYVDISKFKEQKLTLLDWGNVEKSLSFHLKKREETIQNYKDAIGDKAKELKTEVEEIDRKIKKLLDINLFRDISKTVRITEEEFRKTNPFHWGFEFYNIFNGNEGGGFDVMISNPPYIKHQNLRKLSPIFKTLYQSYSGTADIYVYFYERGINLLAKDSYLCFITSNKFMKTSYGKNLRNFLTKDKTIHQIIVFDRVNVFDALVSSSMLFVSTEPSDRNKIFVSTINRNLNPNETILEYINENHFSIEQSYLDKNIWNLKQKDIVEIKNKIESSGKLLEKVEGIKINRGITTGFNEAFLIDETTKSTLLKKSTKNKDILKPLLQGRDIKKWLPLDNKTYTLLTGFDIDIPKHYPDIFTHLKKYENDLVNRADQGKNWWNLRACKYYQEFEKEKIIWGLTSGKWVFALDTKKHYLPSNAYMLTSKKINLKYVLGVLNSKVMQFYFSQIGIMTAGGAYTLKYSTIKKFPLALSSEKIQVEVIQIVDKIIEAKKKNVGGSNYENQLDTLIYKIYGITPEEEKTIRES